MGLGLPQFQKVLGTLLSDNTGSQATEKHPPTRVPSSYWNKLLISTAASELCCSSLSSHCPLKGSLKEPGENTSVRRQTVLFRSLPFHTCISYDAQENLEPWRMDTETDGDRDGGGQKGRAVMGRDGYKPAVYSWESTCCNVCSHNLSMSASQISSANSAVLACVGISKCQPKVIALITAAQDA